MDIYECASRPCLNYGYCTEPNVGSYRCQCLSGFRGLNCEIDIDECASNPCRYTGGNHNNCIDKPDRYECICQFGYYGDNCQYETNECLSNPCNNNGECIDLINGWACNCKSGYQLFDNCAVIQDACFDNVKCLHGGTCENGYFGYDFTCKCQEGFKGEFCQIALDECSSEPCKHEGRCVDLNLSYECFCDYPWSGKRCEINVDFCRSLPCLNRATCSSDEYEFTCHCQPGYTGLNCQLDIDECSSYPCNFEATCENLIDRWICHCHPHFTGERCETRIDFCNFPKQNGFCQDGTGECINIYQESSRVNADFGPTNGYVQPYECLCKFGWTGKWCQEIKDMDLYCASKPCMNGGTCYFGMSGMDPRQSGNSGDKFYTEIKCICPESHTGKYCEKRRDYCEENSPNCGAGKCVSTSLTEWRCVCPLEYADKYCSVHRDEECIQFSKTCRNGKCHPKTIHRNSWCECNKKWSGQHCDIKELYCGSNPCKNSGTCEEDHNEFRCLCLPGYEGETCHNKLDYCASRPCLNLDKGTICQNFQTSYLCVCDYKLYRGSHCEIDIQDDLSNYIQCTPPCHPNHGKCSKFTATCECDEGYYGKDCSLSERMDYCSSHPCQNEGQCYNNKNSESYTCMCPFGHKGDNCEISPEPCENFGCYKGTCKLLFTLPSCECDEGWTGEKCDREVLDADANGVNDTQYVIWISIAAGFILIIGIAGYFRFKNAENSKKGSRQRIQRKIKESSASKGKSRKQKPQSHGHGNRHGKGNSNKKNPSGNAKKRKHK